MNSQMRVTTSWRLPRFLFHLALPLLALIAGCNGSSSEQSFVPATDAAKDALTTALTAWQSGQAKPSLIESATPPVQVADPLWASGAKLKSFEIVGPGEGDMPRKFTVKLTLEGQAAPRDVVYVVVGKSPLIVMPESEYNRDSAM